MAAKTEAVQFKSGGQFLTTDVQTDDVFTREDLSPAQQMFGRIAEDFMSVPLWRRWQAVQAAA
jgi:hypothetical protein